MTPLKKRALTHGMIVGALTAGAESLIYQKFSAQQMLTALVAGAAIALVHFLNPPPPCE